MYKSIEVDKNQMVGKGAHCEVYRIGDDRVMKLYHTYIPEGDIIREQQLAQTAIAHGINTAGVYDIYECGGRLGLLFEYIPTCTLTEYLCEHTDEIDTYAKKFADIARNLHGIKIKDDICNNYKDILHARVNVVQDFYRPKEVKRLHELIDSIPDRATMLHTDFHPGNVMMKGDDLVLIDLADISVGHPVFDLASSYMGLVIIPRHIKKAGNSQTAVLDLESAQRMWDVFIREYLQNNDEKEIKLYEKCSKAITELRFAAAKRIGNEGGEAIGKRVVMLSRFTLFPKISGYERKLRALK